MKWFVREEFLWGPLSTKIVRPSPVLCLCPLSFGDQWPASLASSCIRLVSGKRVPRGVKGCRDYELMLAEDYGMLALIGAFLERGGCFFFKEKVTDSLVGRLGVRESPLFGKRERLDSKLSVKKKRVNLIENRRIARGLL
ncbi:hypothetical protein TNCV_2696601 [Trichonephila clavipes]|nr:hypothetical protein TNCV_2696601 [Trichonephila clavipes]